MTLTPSLAAQLRRLSELTGNSQASLVSELLEGQELVFAKVIRALEAAQEVRGSMVQSLAEDLDRSQAVIESQLGLVLDEFDNGVSPLLAQAEAIKRRKGRAGVPAGTQAKRGRAGTPAQSVTRRKDPHLLTGGSK